MQQSFSYANTDDSHIALLYQRYAPRLLMYIRRHIAAREEAEDILLEVFLAVIEQRDLSRRSDGEQQAWLWRVASNKIADRQRQLIRHPNARLEVITEVLTTDENCAPDQLAIQNEAYTQLRSHLVELPPLQQEVLRLRFACGMRCSEIAQRLNKREGTIRMLLFRTISHLRNIYQQEGEQNDEQHG